MSSTISAYSSKYNLRLKNAKSSDLIKFVTDRQGHDRRYAIDSSKIEIELNWKPKIKFEEGIKRTISWYLKNIEWWMPLLK